MCIKILLHEILRYFAQKAEEIISLQTKFLVELSMQMSIEYYNNGIIAKIAANWFLSIIFHL